MTTLKTVQQAKLAQLSALHGQYVLAKAELRAKVEAEYQNKLRDFELRESRLMNEALILDIPKTVIGRTIGSANWSTLKAKYELTSNEFVQREQLPQFELDLENKTILIHWAEIEGEVVEVESTIPYKWRNIAKDWKLDWKLDDGMKLTTLVNENPDIYPSLPIDDWERAITEAEHENR